MRRWKIIELGSMDTGSTKPFSLKLPSDSKEIVGVSVFSPEYHDRPASEVNLKLSIQTNNKAIFNGNPVCVLGKSPYPGDLNPGFIPLHVLIDGNYIDGYVNVVSNPLGEPFNAQLYILLQ